MKTWRQIAVMILTVGLLLCGCADRMNAEYILPSVFESAEDGIVDENGNYALIWDDTVKCVLLRDKRTGYTWSTTPYDFYAAGETGYSLSSPLVIEYYDPQDNSVQTEKAYECIEEGTVSSKIENGSLSVTFYFEYPEITVTVFYTLREDSVRVSFRSDDLVESGKTKLLNISVTPYFCAVPNSADRDSYIFVPSGSGALMYTDAELGDAARDYSQEVYGYDPARTQLDNPGDEEPIRLPCFGVTDGSNALLGIIESETGAARIDAAAGDAGLGFSNVYATFNVRGYNNIEWNEGNFHGHDVSNDVVMLYDTWPSGREFTVGFYPLSGENADYNGMAECYRNYLKDRRLLQPSKEEQKSYQITLIGGARVKKFFLGIPYDAFSTITDFSQANEIVEQLLADCGEAPAVLLKGFGASGLDAGKIGGGFRFASALGGRKKQAALEKFCVDKGISLYTDFDLIHFTQSGNGFNTFFHSAQTANSETVSQYPKKKNIRTDNTESKSIKFLSRSRISEAAERLISFGEETVSGISLAAFGSTAYSDYNHEEFMLKGASETQADEVIGALRQAGHSIFLSAANAYAAGISDGITDVPLQNGAYNALDETIPFYQMVYGGSIPLYSTPVNLSVDAQQTLLRAVEAGVSPSFTLGYTLDFAYTANADTLYYGISYQHNCERISDITARTKDYFSEIRGSVIKEHRIIADGVTKTVFENGTVVYVNHSSADVTAEDVLIPALSFVYEGTTGGS